MPRKREQFSLFLVSLFFEKAIRRFPSITLRVYVYFEMAE